MRSAACGACLPLASFACALGCEWRLLGPLEKAAFSRKPPDRRLRCRCAKSRCPTASPCRGPPEPCKSACSCLVRLPGLFWLEVCDELPSPLSAYAPGDSEFSVGEDVIEGMDDVERRPSLEADMLGDGRLYATVGCEERASSPDGAAAAKEVQDISHGRKRWWRDAGTVILGDAERMSRSGHVQSTIMGQHPCRSTSTALTVNLRARATLTPATRPGGEQSSGMQSGTGLRTLAGM